VLVLNATYEPINVCTVRRAVVLLLKEKAELLERGHLQLHSESSTIARPVVIRLITYVKVPRDAHRRKITRRAVFARDSWTCQYCGSRSNLTVDHVIPRSKGGASSWENIVASCAPCNRRKGDRLPRQAGMHPRRAPRTPVADPRGLAAVPASGRLRLAPRGVRRPGARQRLLERGGCPDWHPPRYYRDWKGRDGESDAAGGTRTGGRLGVSRVGFAKRSSLPA
jgi:5-methylcytosine-specific restriction endonuclease McrA